MERERERERGGDERETREREREGVGAARPSPALIHPHPLPTPPPPTPLPALPLSYQAAYGLYTRLPFSAFGESLLLLAQNTILLGLIYKFNRTPGRAAAAVAVGAAGVGALLTPGTLTPARAARAVEAVSLLMLAARLPQIAANARAKSTGQLSVVTYAANTAGAAARIFTSLTEGGGSALVRSYALSAALNGTLVAQILAYAKKGRGGGAGRRGGRAKAAPRRRAKAA